MPPKGSPSPGDLMQSPIWLPCLWMLCGTETLACLTFVPSHDCVHRLWSTPTKKGTRRACVIEHHMNALAV